MVVAGVEWLVSGLWWLAGVARGNVIGFDNMLGEPRRTQENPEEPRRAQANPGEPKRAQENSGEPRRTQKNPGEPRSTQENPGEPSSVP